MTKCFPEGSATQEILVVQNASAQLQALISGLELFGSVECMAAARPFLCVSFFGGVCDRQGVRYFPTFQECEEITNGPCQTEFELAQSVGMEIIDCSMLPRIGFPSVCSNASQEFGSGGSNSKFSIPCVNYWDLATYVVASLTEQSICLE